MNPIPLNPVPSEKLLGPGHGPSVWPLRERLALASALLDVDNQQTSWSGISRQLSRFTTPGRPESWCSARACAKQYALLLDAVELTRRQKTPAEQSRMHILHAAPIPAATIPGLSVAERLVKRLTAERVEELRARIRLGQKYYSFLKQFVSELESGKLDSHLSTIRDVVHGGATQDTKASDKESASESTQMESKSVSLVQEFTNLWSELDTVYTVPDSTWVCPPGPGGGGAGTGSGTTGSGGNKSSGTTGSASLNRLCALLAEASSAIQTPCREKSRRAQDGRARPLGWIRPHSDAAGGSSHSTTATTRAAVATRQRYLSNASKKRITLQNGIKRRVGRPRKYPLADGKGPENQFGASQTGSYPLSTRDSEMETADECYSLDMIDSHSEQPNRGASSGASTPSTTAMCVSDTEELLPDITEHEEAIGTPSMKYVEEDADGTSPGSVSITSGLEHSVSTQNGGSNGQYPFVDDEEPVTPAMCELEQGSANSQSSSQATEAASHQDTHASHDLVLEQTDALIAHTESTQLENETEEPNEFDNSLSVPVLEASISAADIVLNQQVAGNEASQPFTEPETTRIQQLITNIEINFEPYDQTAPGLTETEVLIPHSPPAALEGAPLSSSCRQSPDQTQSILESADMKPSANVDLRPSPVSNRSPIQSSALRSLRDFSGAESAKATGDDLQSSESVRKDELSEGQLCFEEHTPTYNHEASQVHSSISPALGDEGPCLQCSAPTETSPSYIVPPHFSSPSSPEQPKQKSDVCSPPTGPTTSPQIDRKQTPLDVTSLQNSSNPSGRELTIELSPANLSYLEKYCDSVLLESVDCPKQLNSKQKKNPSRTKSKRTKTRRRSSCKPSMSEMLSKGSPVVQLSNMMLPLSPSGIETGKTASVPVDLNATVTLEPICFPCSTESSQQISFSECPSQEDHSLAVFYTSPVSPKSPSLRMRFYRRGSQLTVTQPSSDTQCTPVNDPERENVSWCHDVVKAAKEALDNFTRHEISSPHSTDSECEAIRTALQSMQLRLNNGEIEDRQSLTHQLLSALARFVMTYPSKSVICRAARYVYTSIDWMLPAHRRSKAYSLPIPAREMTASPSAACTPKRIRKRTRVS